jgi:hypothetical protein
LLGADADLADVGDLDGTLHQRGGTGHHDEGYGQIAGGGGLEGQGRGMELADGGQDEREGLRDRIAGERGADGKGTGDGELGGVERTGEVAGPGDEGEAGIGDGEELEQGVLGEGGLVGVGDEVTAGGGEKFNGERGERDGDRGGIAGAGAEGIGGLDRVRGGVFERGGGRLEGGLVGAFDGLVIFEPLELKGWRAIGGGDQLPGIAHGEGERGWVLGEGGWGGRLEGERGQAGERGGRRRRIPDMTGEEIEDRAEADGFKGLDGGIEGRSGGGGPGAELDEDGLAGWDIGDHHRGGREIAGVGAIEKGNGGEEGQEGFGRRAGVELGEEGVAG